MNEKLNKLLQEAEKPNKETTAPHCVQCGKEMEYGLSFEDLEARLIRLQTCNDPNCSKFGLLQLGIEGMRPAVFPSSKKNP